MCQLWQFQKSFEYLMTIRKRRGTDCKFQVPNHQVTGHEKFFNSMSQARIPQTKHRATECNSKVSKHRETSRMECQSGFNLSKKKKKKASLVICSCAELRAIWAAMHWRTRSQTRAHSRGLHRSDSSVASSATVERDQCAQTVEKHTHTLLHINCLHQHNASTLLSDSFVTLPFSQYSCCKR